MPSINVDAANLQKKLMCTNNFLIFYVLYLRIFGLLNQLFFAVVFVSADY